MFHFFEGSEARISFGGSAFMELQYCKLKPNASIRKIVSIRSLPYWENDGLYIYVDDIDCFLSNYGEIFDNGILNYRATGSIDAYGINYYTPIKLNEIICKIEKQKPLEYETLLEWLKKGIDYNGIYILGI